MPALVRNPDAALSALLDGGADGRARPITPGLWALLEKIGSPAVMADAGAPAPARLDLAPWVPTLYAFGHTQAECEDLFSKGRDAFEREARIWADTFDMAEGTRRFEAVARRLNILAGINPDGGAEGGADTPQNPTAATGTAGS